MEPGIRTGGFGTRPYIADETAASLRAFFQKTLPLLVEDWWARHVVNALTFQQQRRVEESRVESLDQN